ncbi:MAG: LacI family DNA-binding transcriptional regulator [Candidatus Omnitrophica bacterium]|nr:LacI family DNA-binding transcriptional regulator [Candidatus Omnitrophota bacterium]
MQTIITLKDVSRKAQVSVGTVSRVLSRSKTAVPISERTRAKVLKIAEELNYHPNIFARGLRLRKSYTIGLIIADIEDPFYGPIIRGIEEILLLNGYHFLLSDAKNDGTRETFCCEDLLKRQVDGILISGVPANVKEKGMEILKQKQIPVVLIGRISRLNFPVVIVDNEKGGFYATEHLIKLGHRRIGFLSGPEEQPDCLKRLIGYKMALKRYDIKFEECLIAKANHTPETGYTVMKELLQSIPGLTACFAYNDLIAVGAMRAINEEGIKIPEDFSIIGYDDIRVAPYLEPPLTTIRQPLKEMGVKAASLILKLISSKKAKDTNAILEPELVIRKSTGMVKNLR